MNRRRYMIDESVSMDQIDRIMDEDGIAPEVTDRVSVWSLDLTDEDKEIITPFFSESEE